MKRTAILSVLLVVAMLGTAHAKECKGIEFPSTCRSAVAT